MLLPPDLILLSPDLILPQPDFILLSPDLNLLPSDLILLSPNLILLLAYLILLSPDLILHLTHLILLPPDLILLCHEHDLILLSPDLFLFFTDLILLPPALAHPDEVEDEGVEVADDLRHILRGTRLDGHLHDLSNHMLSNCINADATQMILYSYFFHNLLFNFFSDT